MKTKGRVCGTLCMIATIAYAIYIISYFNNIEIGSKTPLIAAAIAKKLVTPHIICVVLAGLFSMIGVFLKQRWAMLVCAFSLIISMVLFKMYAAFVALPIILAFISFARMGIVVDDEEELEESKESEE